MFVQTKLDPKERPIYVEMPQMFEKLRNILKLNRSLYGWRQSSLNFFLHWKEGHEQQGFEQSKLDPCLFTNGQVICLVYVDDCVFFSKNKEDINAFIQDLKKISKSNHKSFLLDKESNVAGFLGFLFSENTKF